MSFRVPFGNISIWEDPWDYFPGQSRLFDQHFGLGMTDDDFIPPLSYRGMTVRPRARRQVSQTGARGVSEVVNNENEFRAIVDVSHFTPDEISVKTVDNRLIINAKHEEKQDEHGYIKREFTRQYVIPKDVNMSGMESFMSKDGVLTVKAPKLAIEASNERQIPIKIDAIAQDPKGSKQVDQEMAESNDGK